MKSFSRLPQLILCLGLLLVLTACAATPKQPSAGEYLDDTVITTKVKTAIFAEPTLKSLEITVVTYRGIVQLSGFVDSRDNVGKAEEIAKGVPGVKEVRNDLIVK